MKNILILDGHPYDQSLCRAIADAYQSAATESGASVQRLNIRDLKFNPNLEKGYAEIQALEPDLVRAQEMIKSCEHLVLVFPLWWGAPPAQLKGFFDRAFLPGYAFRYHAKDPFWDRLLAGRSARMIVTSDAPRLFNFFAYGDAPYQVVKKMILRFSGFKPVKVTAIGGVKYLDVARRQAVLQRIRKLGKLQK